MSFRAAALALSLLAGTVTGVSAPAGAASSTVGFSFGVTHGMPSIDWWGDPASISRAKALVQTTARYQNQHLMGWGVPNPEPSPGVYDWSALDARVALIRSTGGTPVLTLCCSPDWMKGGQPGTTDWSKLDRAPLASHYGDFADLAATAALRYPDIKYFQVWNELKGFWNTAANNWDAAAYTALYNTVYTAVKRVRPDAMVGGPYVTVDSWSSAAATSNPSTLTGLWGVVDQRSLDVISYWLANKVGADFITVDAWTSTRDRGMITDAFTATQKFSVVTDWIRARTTLPIWWAEFYAPVYPGGTQATQAAVVMASLIRFVDSGVSTALLWQPEQAADSVGWVWTPTAAAGGGQPGPLTPLLQSFQQYFGPTETKVSVGTLPTNVMGAATARGVLLVNRRTTGPVTITLSGKNYVVPAQGAIVAAR